MSIQKLVALDKRGAVLKDSRSPVTVIMPTYKQAWHIEKSINSVIAQTFSRWKLLIVDDGSPDDTRGVVGRFSDRRIQYVRRPSNYGLAATLNFAYASVSTDYVAYLSSDNSYHPHHLQSLVNLLNAESDTWLAYGGLQSNHTTRGWRSMTLGGPDVAGHELEGLKGLRRQATAPFMPSSNVLSLSQVLHRNNPPMPAWPERSAVVSDRLEADRWRELLEGGTLFSNSGQISVNWNAHPDQRHKIIAQGRGPQPTTRFETTGRGLSGYKAYYGVDEASFLNWQPSRGPRFDENKLFMKSSDIVSSVPTDPARRLRILLVGELGFNPDRMLDLQARGHILRGLWTRRVEEWDFATSIPSGIVSSLPLEAGRSLAGAIKEFAPDVVYALLNYQSLPIINEYLEVGLDLPLIFHFKESQFLALREGLWPILQRVVRRCAGLIFISPENANWFEVNMPESRDKPRLIIDGDLPSARWLKPVTDQMLSREDGQIHTVVSGRPLGLEYATELFDLGMHLHVYGANYYEYEKMLHDHGVPKHLLHMHDTVDPTDWSWELSKYDAAWTHILTPSEKKFAAAEPTWAHLNLPGRLGTYAIAGLPWIVDGASAGPISSVRELAERFGMAVTYDGPEALMEKLKDETGLREQRAQCLKSRHMFTFAAHLDDLENFFLALR